MLTRGQAQSKLEGVLSGIGGGDGGEALEWELPSDHEEEEAVQSSALRLTEEWKQYEATYGQSYTERYFASYYHAQVVPLPSPPPSSPPLPPPSSPYGQFLSPLPDAARVWRRCRSGLPQAERAPHRPPAVIVVCPLRLYQVRKSNNFIDLLCRELRR
jgi:hypothetical protein